MSQVRFLAPSPLWDDLAGTPAAYRAPALLRFAGDDFIEQYQRTLAAEPPGLRDFVARPESWRAPRAGLAAPAPTAQNPLRLWQPVHGRFYLAAVSLACRVPGLPEHTVDAAAGETVGLVLRRLTVTGTGSAAAEAEWAWVKRADGSEGWTPATALALAPDEEVAPMFATTYPAERKRTRRVFAGLVPASRRETLVNGRELAAAPPPPAPGSQDDPRVIEFQRAVLDPWVELIEGYDAVKADATARPAARDAVAMASPYLLLDLHDFLRDHLPAVWDVVRGAKPATSLTPVPVFAALHQALAGVHVATASGAQRTLLPGAMVHAAGFRAPLEAPANPLSPLPAGYHARLLAGDPDGVPTADGNAVRALVTARLQTPEEAPGIGVRVLKKRVMDALAKAGPAPAVLPEQLPTRAPAPAGDGEWFVIRCVYQRPHCGRKAPPVVSDRSERFALTSYFDPDAPARHLRVALPVDTSPATLRKYNRNVAFALSEQLRKQMSRASSLKDLVDGKAGSEDGSLKLGVICSFSIPIITICAIILLMILVSLLNIVFWWKPFFKICFPVPKLK